VDGSQVVPRIQRSIRALRIGKTPTFLRKK